MSQREGFIVIKPGTRLFLLESFDNVLFVNETIVFCFYSSGTHDCVIKNNSVVKIEDRPNKGSEISSSNLEESTHTCTIGSDF